MDKLQEWKSRTNWIVACLIVALSYEFRYGVLGDLFLLSGASRHIIIVLVSVALLIIAVNLSNFITVKVFKFRGLRQRLMKENFVEGFWLLKTAPLSDDNEESLISPVGILHLTYDPETEQYSVNTTRLKDNGEPYRVCSKLVKVRPIDNEVQYLNHFILNEPYSQRQGVSQGAFKKISGSEKLELYTYIYTENEPMRRQTGFKILPEQVENNGCNFSESGDWVVPYLKKVSLDENKNAKDSSTSQA